MLTVVIGTPLALSFALLLGELAGRRRESLLARTYRSAKKAIGIAAIIAVVAIFLPLLLGFLYWTLW